MEKSKKKTRSQLIKILDAIFSQYIRLRDSDTHWIVTCPLCWIKKLRKQMQNMHFVTRACLALRRDETNCHAWCYRCNVLLKGNYIEYTIFMINTYWLKYVELLKIKKTEIFKIQTWEIEEKIQFYKNKILILSKNKKV